MADIDLKNGVQTKKLTEGLWLVGWVFGAKKYGEDTVKALADLYHAFDEREKQAQRAPLYDEQIAAGARALQNLASAGRHRSIDDVDAREAARAVLRAARTVSEGATKP